MGSHSEHNGMRIVVISDNYLEEGDIFHPRGCHLTDLQQPIDAQLEGSKAQMRVWQKPPPLTIPHKLLAN